MLWKLSLVEGAEIPANWDGRFVLHRHRDAQGPHLDLRLEHDGFLTGWRIDGLALGDVAWATAKPPHSAAWLDRDGDAVRERAGVYAWAERDAHGGTLVLHDRGGRVTCLKVEQEPGLPAGVVRSVMEVLAGSGFAETEAAALIVDGMTARQRAVGRLCGLGRELEGTAFDEALWRKTLRHLSLDEVHAQLRSFEIRFDAKYPPQPVSRPERLDGEAAQDREEVALAIARQVL
ncbi:MAG TPA: hypothetical protein PLO37_12170 [Candidatus Hydrogenedentes bacterium]|nr:hypothetical protein [Candidatus Hydrogenedentota bacterium]HPG67598.1 hypothetical protein [Candidatus Hydrogenedentota bacterium]